MGERFIVQAATAQANNILLRLKFMKILYM